MSGNRLLRGRLLYFLRTDEHTRRRFLINHLSVRGIRAGRANQIRQLNSSVLVLHRYYLRLFTKHGGRHTGDNVLLATVATFTVANKLVLSVIPNPARVTVVGFFLKVTTLVVIAISNSREAFGAVLALIWLLTCVDPHVDEKISSLVEQFLAVSALVVTRAEVSNLYPHNVPPLPRLLRLVAMRRHVVLNLPCVALD
jgi:hypothetical protein